MPNDFDDPQLSRKELRATRKRPLWKLERKEEVRRVTAHETAEKRQSRRLHLHCVRLERQLEQSKAHLSSYDAVAEAEKQQAEIAKAEQLANLLPRNKRPRRKGPEFWTLKGAARPAWQVYDFDVRYKCPHIQAHEDAKLKAQRTVNALVVYRGRLDQGPAELRKYLALLLEYGYTCVEAKKTKAARQAFLECIDLEGNDQVLSTAREAILQLYIDCKKYEAALKLGKEKFSKDTSASVSYTMAWLALHEKDEQAHMYIVHAVKSNPLCAWYLAYLDTFREVMECIQDVLEADTGAQSSLEEAIEYCNGEQVDFWTRESKHLEILRSMLLSAYKGEHETLKKQDVDWNEWLDRLEKDLQKRNQSINNTNNNNQTSETGLGKNSHEVNNSKSASTNESIDVSLNDEIYDNSTAKLKADRSDDSSDASSSDSTNDDSSDNSNKDKEPVTIDLEMYINMFRTAMDILKASGKLQ